jgi:hypothetical protein
VLDAIDRTQALARDFTYTEKAGGHTTVVKGSIHDDLRYSVASTVDGAPGASEVVVDDSRALRVSDGSLLTRMASHPSVPGGAGPAPGVQVGAGALPSPPAQIPPDLTAGRWVVDKAGASAFGVGASLNARDVGRNPLLDAITALEYVRGATNQAQDVARFNPESETYRPKLDPFPRPRSGVLRYDVVPLALKPRSHGPGGSLEVTVPDTAFFRLMAIYVQDGVIVEVREKIDIEARLKDPQSNLQARLGEFVSVPPGTSTGKQGSALLAKLNASLPTLGKPPVRLRELDLSFTNLGHSGIVTLPADSSPGDLSAVGAHGQVLFEHR